MSTSHTRRSSRIAVIVFALPAISCQCVHAQPSTQDGENCSASVSVTPEQSDPTGALLRYRIEATTSEHTCAVVHFSVRRSYRLSNGSTYWQDEPWSVSIRGGQETDYGSLQKTTTPVIQWSVEDVTCRVCEDAGKTAKCAEQTAAVSQATDDSEALNGLRWIKTNCSPGQYASAVSSRAAVRLEAQQRSNRDKQQAASMEAARRPDVDADDDSSSTAAGNPLAAPASKVAMPATSGKPGMLSQCQDTDTWASQQLRDIPPGNDMCSAYRSDLAQSQIVLQAIARCPESDPSGAIAREARQKIVDDEQGIRQICVTARPPAQTTRPSNPTYRATQPSAPPRACPGCRRVP